MASSERRQPVTPADGRADGERAVRKPGLDPGTREPGLDPAAGERAAAQPGHPPLVDEREPRIVDEQVVVGPYGEEQVEAIDDRGRRWIALRPQPRGRYDVLGFGMVWWLLFWLIIIGLIVWGWGWGY